ncbi:MAG: MotA/TolQ/ExbB proton channel family protein [Pseudomonadota bacterium]|nr:MotA/TolQ/ExbB proton channel family protein [Pseudomonadota bacterium]
MQDRWNAILGFMEMGGIAIWVIAGLAVITAGLILWKVLRLGLSGTWRPGRTERAVRMWQAGDRAEARRLVDGRNGVYAVPVRAAMDGIASDHMTPDTRREEVSRVAAGELFRQRKGLRALELVATIAPLVGLLGTVLGMVAAFQALEAAGSRADPSDLAGGIWEALLTTAAGMAVAIPASAALTWFESIADRAQGRIEDMVTRLLLSPEPEDAQQVLKAAE